MVANRVRRRLRATGIETLLGVLHVPDLARRRRRDAPVPRRDHHQRDLLLSATCSTTTGSERRSSPRSPAGRLQRKRPKALRIWSAACSTGEEPYSIALKLLAKKPLFAGLEDHDLVGTDLSGAVLAAARAGSYDDRAVRLVEPEERKRYFEEDAEAKRWTVKPELRSHGHLEAAQPAHAAQGRTVRLHLHQECADLLRHGVQADRGAQPARRPGQGGYLVVGPTEGIYTMLDPLDQAQTLALSEALLKRRPAMSGFDLAELLPFYLDETDEHIAALNDALLRLEQDPTDAKALAEAFRMFHSIKGASVVMGFEPVNRLTHHLESLFDQFRVKKRTLDRPVLDLTFRCLDELRDYHRELLRRRAGDADLAALLPS